MIEFFTQLGQHTTLVVGIFVLLFLYWGVPGKVGITITWSCAKCGKMNQTNLLQYMIGWCDHTPFWN